MNFQEFLIKRPSPLEIPIAIGRDEGLTVNKQITGISI